jgi:hypothetical protein
VCGRHGTDLPVLDRDAPGGKLTLTSPSASLLAADIRWTGIHCTRQRFVRC